MVIACGHFGVRLGAPRILRGIVNKSPQIATQDFFHVVNRTTPTVGANLWYDDALLAPRSDVSPLRARTSITIAPTMMLYFDCQSVESMTYLWWPPLCGHELKYHLQPA